MAPKKLTDCPENLREAIDWLIQIRYGNGQGDQGLNELAKALKKLIGEAIGNAYTTNVNALLQLLESAKSYTCCKDKVVEIGKLKDFEKIEDESLAKLLRRVEAHKTSCYNHLDDSQQKAYLDIQSRLDQLKSLIEILNGFTNLDSCKQLLTNLCSGLETFLGFDPESKGYTGEGIVYSDLDRLCDAVMAFLHGVLANVQNDSSVKHYDDIIEKERKHNNIKNAVTYLSSRLNAGKSEFEISVDQVKQGLEGYLNKVVELSNKVFGPDGKIKNLEKQIQSNMEKTGECSSKPFDSVVSELAATVVDSLEENVNGVRDTIGMLDEPLKMKLIGDCEKIRIEVSRIQKSAKRAEFHLKGVGQHVFNRLEALRKKIERAIREQVNKMQYALEENIKYIKLQVHKVDSLLGGYVSELTEWIRQAEEILKNALEKIEEILDAVKDGRIKNKGRGQKTLINEKATEMQAKAEALHGAYEEAKRGVQRQAAAAVSAIQGLEEAYITKLNDMKKKIDDKVKDATLALKGLDKEVQKGFRELQNRVNPAIQGVISKLRGGIEKSGGQDTFSTVVVIQNFMQTLVKLDDPELYKWAEKANTGSLRSVIDKLEDNCSSLAKFRAVLSELSKDQNGAGTFYDALTKEIQKQVENAMNKVKGIDQFSEVFSAFHKEITDGGDEDTVYKKIEDITTQFKGDFNDSKDNPEFIQNNVDSDGLNRSVLEAAIQKTYNGGFVQADATIQEQKIEKGTTFQTLLRAISGEVDRIAGMVDKTAGPTASRGDDGVKQFIVQLRAKITTATGNELTHIRDKIDSLRTDTVMKLKQAVDTLLSKIVPSLAHSTISTTNKHVSDQIENTVEDIKKEILKRYVITASKELAELKAFVADRSIAIKEIIENDNKTGIKGLIKSMSGVEAEASAKPAKELNNLDALKNAGNSVTAQGNKLKDVSFKSHAYLVRIYRYVHFDILMNFDAESTVGEQYSGNISTIKAQLDVLLTHIATQKHFDHQVPAKLETLKKTVDNFKSSKFGNASYPVLDAFPQSLVPFVEQLERVYINTYEGGKKIEKWFTNVDTALTEESRQAAKVCLTILKTIHTDLNIIQKHCGTKLGYDVWKDKKICEVQNRAENPLGSFLKRCGYKVPSNDEGSKQDGELKCKENMKGENILEMLGKIRVSTTATPNVIQLLDNMNSHLNEYNKVCHLRNIQSPKVPCSIYEMLVWLTGLCYNGVYDKLKSQIKTCCVKPANREKEEYSAIDPKELKLEKTWTITAQHLFDIIEKLCTDSHSILAAILGPGDAQTVYACDYSNNSLRLHYPQSGEDCLQMFIDILLRLFPAMRFLESQCIYSASEFGWAQCVYGKAVDSSSWRCDDNSNTKLNCQPTSPLMSYLNDSLPGHLPHQLEVVGCKSECKTCSTSKPGTPCLTPLGFRAFSGSTKTGKELCRVIRNFFANTHLSSLFCLMPRPPSTLPEHFGYAFSLVKGWGSTNSHPLRTAIESSIRDRSINLYQQPSDLTIALSDAYGSSQGGHNHKNANNPKAVDLSSLSMKTTCAGTKLNFHCAPYLSSLCQDYYDHLPNKHSKLYLSWAVYLPWQFWEFLNNLHGSFQNISCQDWGCRGCLDGRSCKPGHHGAVDAPCHCKSIVTCKGASPTLYRSGFTFGDASILNAAKTSKNCVDFRIMLKRVINSTYFTSLFKECDNVLWRIREPFSYLVLSLWLLSLLYLIHIMVIRLDLLHIKSHLHSPSSHRIAAQSLLAAARVNKLAKLTYLQP